MLKRRRQAALFYTGKKNDKTDLSKNSTAFGGKNITGGTVSSVGGVGARADEATKNLTPKNSLKTDIPKSDFNVSNMLAATDKQNRHGEKQQEKNKVLYLAPWHDDQPEESLYNVMKGMNSAVDGLFEDTLKEYETEQRNFKEKLRILTEDYKQKRAMYERQKNMQKNSINYDTQSLPQNLRQELQQSRPQTAKDTENKNYTAPQTPRTAVYTGNTSLDNIARLNKINAYDTENDLEKSKTTLGNNLHNNENKSTNLLNNLNGNGTMKYNGKSAETVVKNKKRKDTTKEKELTLDDMIQRIFYENSDKSILALYPKYLTEPNINNAESTDEYNRKATTYWNNQKELSEIEKYLNFLRRPEPNPSDYATMEEYVKIATDYWEGRKRLLENNKYKTDMIADALSIWRNIQEERNPYKQNTMLIEFKEWLAENDMKDYVPGEPYL